jgi:AraC-like DNA-binding protein
LSLERLVAHVNVLAWHLSISGDETEGLAECEQIVHYATALKRRSSVTIACAVLMGVVSRVSRTRIGSNAEAWLQTTASLCGRGSLLELLALLQKALSTQSNPTRTGDRRVSAALEYVTQHYADVRLDLATVSSHVGLSNWHLERLLARHTRIPFKQHVTCHRLDAAERLLSYTFLSIKEIAAECGFGNVQSFERSFLRRFGKPPSRWRREVTQHNLTTNSKI